MNKKNVLAAVAGISVSAVAAVCLLTIGGKTPLFVLGTDGSVPHQVVFGKEDVTEFIVDSGYALAEVAKTTDAGNRFASSMIEIQDYTTEGPSQGGEDDNYLFLIHHFGWSHDYVDSTVAFSISFDMKVDVEDSITATVTRTVHYDDGESQSNSQKAEAFDIVSKETGSSLEYEFKFTNKDYQYVTIDAVTVNYSCTY